MNNDPQKALSEFQTRIGVSFNDVDLLRTAFTHRSYVNESNMPLEHNERLEFLGDAVLELVVTDYIFKHYPETPEGMLTAYRAALVNTSMLASVAESLAMHEPLFLSRGEAKDLERARTSLLANTLEAVIGALYLDQGYETARQFVTTHVVTRIDEVVETGAWKDAKSAFQELAQAKYGMTPHYEVVRAEGPDHDKHFVVSLSVGDIVICKGEGRSKQDAEQKAAARALSEEKHTA